MSDLFRDPLFYLGLSLIVLLPASILALGEMKSRMARSGSRLFATVSYARSWVIPVLTLWAVLVLIAGTTRELVPVRLLETLLLAVAVSAGLKLIHAIFVATNADGEAPDWRKRVPGLLLAAPRLILFGTGAYLLASLWGLDVSQAFAALGVGSLVIALALQDTLSGLVSGFLLMADRPFQPGDWIHAGDVEGRVVDVRWRTVRVMTRQNTLIVVPNAVLSGQVIRNHSAPEQLHRIDIDFDIAFSNSPSAARQMLLNAAGQTRGILTEPEPLVAVTRVDDPLMGYQVQAWIESYDLEPSVISELRDRVWYQCQRDNVPLPSPAYDLYHWDGLATAAAGEVDPADVENGLRSARVVRSLDQLSFEQLVRATRPVTFAAGELILGPDDRLPDLFVLGSGAATVFLEEDGEERIFDDMGPGDLFGLVSLTDLDLVTGVRATEDCELFQSSRNDVFALLTRQGVIADELKRLGALRSRRAARVASAASLATELTSLEPEQSSLNGTGSNRATNGVHAVGGSSSAGATAVIDLREADDPLRGDDDVDDETELS